MVRPQPETPRHEMTTNADLQPYRERYFAFLRALAETRLVTIAATHVLTDFPEKLPREMSRVYADLFERMAKALFKAADEARRRAGAVSVGEVSAAVQEDAAADDETSEFVAADRDSREFSIHALELLMATSSDTANEIDPHDGERFIAGAQQQAVALLFAHLDAFLADTLRTILAARPGALRRDKRLTWRKALEFSDYDQLRAHLIEEWTYEFGWGTVSQRLSTLEEQFGLTIPASELEREKLSVLEQQRHLVIHNGGVVSHRYVRETKDRSAVVGEPLCLTRDTTRELYGAVRRVGSDIFVAVARKLFGARRKDLNGVWMRRGTGDEREESASDT